MPKILELPSNIAHLIAAGEVVERPSSVVKELVENSIDAGSTEITIEIKNGGITYIRVSDNGCAISREDAAIAFKRHATSKIRTEADLESIGSLGFRGEALCAIAAVSKVEMRTKQRFDQEGTLVKISGDQIQAVEPCACNDGTTIVICDIFYNIPARMKFLKQDSSEASYINTIVQKIAVMNADIAVKFIKDGKEVFLTKGDGDLKSAIYSIYGKEIATDIDYVDYTKDGIRAVGYISKPFNVRSSRSMQIFFVNKRYVKSQLIQAAVEQAYRNYIASGKFPYCVLNVMVDSGLTDVNVHPAKTEVKFYNDKTVFNAVYTACRNVVENSENIPAISVNTAEISDVGQDMLTDNQQNTSNRLADEVCEKTEYTNEKDDLFLSTTDGVFAQPSALYKAYGKEQLVSWKEFEALPKLFYRGGSSCGNEDDSIKKVTENHKTHVAVYDESKTESQERFIKHDISVSAEDFFDDITIIGQCFETYILVQRGNELLLVDKHAAHERMIFNKLKANFNGQDAGQILLCPIVITLSMRELDVFCSNIEAFNRLGFDAEVFGEDGVAVRRVPICLIDCDIKDIFLKVIDDLIHNKIAEIDLVDRLLESVSCRAAIKAGNKTDKYEMEFLVSNVLKEDKLKACPHGRPTVIRLTKHDIEKMFKRS